MVNRKSIIPYTITCPYCGHRTLPENMAHHIRAQHPSEYEDDTRSLEMTTLEPNRCPYCNKGMPLKKLERHITKAHPLEKKIAEQRVAAKEKEERLEKRLHLQYLNSPAGRRSIVKAAWQEEQEAQKDQQKLERDQESIFCPYCYQPIRRCDLDVHIELKHSDRNKPG